MGVITMLITWAGFSLTAVLLGVKLLTKIVGVYPVCRAFRLERRVSTYTTLLMSTGLTFGTISALFGLAQHYISQSQYTILVAVVIGSAVVPSMIAQTFFRPLVELPPEAGESLLPEARVPQPSPRPSAGQEA